ncbi:MAG TPA: YebC/PmpR family DNA-binding transcriptional regulator, partial [Woeseiaceae bacterium]|nr:YebC/PmpR family DNA-binding transcriptional regulator [Woeseiaceae bacterium]
VRHAFSKHGGNLGADGSVSYLFNHVGLLSYPPGSNEDAIMSAAIDAGAEDVIVDEDKSIQVLTDPVEMEAVRDAMQAAGLPPGDAELTMWAATTTELGFEEASSMVRLLEALEDLDDVQNVYSNADIRDDVLSQL